MRRTLSFVFWVVSFVPIAGQAGAADDVVWEESNARLEYRCEAGEALSLDGAGNRLTLSGDCGSLRIEGSMNRVTAERLASVEIEGAQNTLEIVDRRARMPKIMQNEGVGNRVTRAGR